MHSQHPTRGVCKHSALYVHNRRLWYPYARSDAHFHQNYKRNPIKRNGFFGEHVHKLFGRDGAGGVH